MLPSDTREGAVRWSCQESRCSSPSFEFALQSIKSMKGTNQIRDKQHGGTLDFTYIEEFDCGWGKSVGGQLCGRSEVPQIL